MQPPSAPQPLPNQTKPSTLATQPFKLATTPSGTLNITLAPATVAPTPLWATPAVLAGGAFVGVLITIAFGAWKMKKELGFAAQQANIERDQSREQASLDRQYQSEQAHQERITKARREVYLEVISEMIKAQVTLSLLPTQDIEKLDIGSGLNGLITAVSKVSVLGEMATVVMSRELLTVIHQTLFRLLALVVPIHEDKSNVAHHEQRYTAQLAKIEQLVTEIQTIKETSNDQNELQRLRKALDFRNADMERYGAASMEAKLTLLARQKRYDDTVLAETKAIRRKTDELVASIREELSLTTSLNQLYDTSEEMNIAATIAIKELRANFGEVE
jgi:hypothetical protein